MQIVWHASDDALRFFIQEYLDSFCSWDLLVFLAHNPESVDTPRGLATRIGRPVSEIASCLARLSEKGLIESASAFGEQLYRLSGDEEQLSVLQRFARMQSDPATRTEALRRIMESQADGVSPA